MDDKVFGLLEKMYIEMQEMKSNMATKDDIVNMATKDDIAKINHSIVRLEGKMDINHKTLYDGFKQSIEGITEINDKLEKLTDRVENQEIKLQVLRSVK